MHFKELKLHYPYSTVCEVLPSTIPGLSFIRANRTPQVKLNCVRRARVREPPDTQLFISCKYSETTRISNPCLLPTLSSPSGSISYRSSSRLRHCVSSPNIYRIHPLPTRQSSALPSPATPTAINIIPHCTDKPQFERSVFPIWLCHRRPTLPLQPQ